MSTETLLTISRLEARHLADLVAQFVTLLEESRTEGDDDDAVARLTPSAYPDDRAEDAQFADATHDELIRSRTADAQRMLHALSAAFADDEAELDPARALYDVALDEEAGWAWLRTLTALRLVIATRLGIVDDDGERDADDERFAVYDWLGYRLDGLVGALGGNA